MAHRQFSVTIESSDPAKTVIGFTGYIDRRAQSSLADLDDKLREKSVRDVTLNLAAVAGLDGSGLQLLTLFLWKLHTAGFRLAAIALPDWLYQLMHLTQLDTLLTIDPASPGAAMLVNLEWCPPVTRIDCSGMPAHAVTVNTCCRLPLPPFSGFGPLWQRTYRVALPGVSLSPSEVMAVWMGKFTGFWPAGNELITPASGLQPGTPAVIHLSLPGGMKVYTGALVMHAGAESFSLVTLQGHMFCGWITFSSFEEDNVLHIQTHALLRPSDLLFDLSFRLGFGTRAEDAFWHASLLNLAAHFGVQGHVRQTNALVDKRVQWRHLGNLWYNAGIRSVLYSIAHPFAARKLARREHP